MLLPIERRTSLHSRELPDRVLGEHRITVQAVCVEDRAHVAQAVAA
jgi:hypothetical protein